MLNFSANLSMLFTEAPFMRRFALAAQAGFKGVEYVSPYGEARDTIAAELKKHSLSQALFNLPAGDWEAGERGIACHPGRVAEFQRGITTAIDYAGALGCKKVNCLAGLLPEGVSRAEARATLIENLRYAAPRLKEAGVLLIAEPINYYDIPGFFLNTSAQALEIFDAASVGNLKLQYDIYHMQRMEGEIANTLTRLLPRIGHIQIADTPGRHEPGTGELNYPFLFQHLESIGYEGWVGCEYRPAATTQGGLGWMKAMGRGLLP